LTTRIDNPNEDTKLGEEGVTEPATADDDDEGNEEIFAGEFHPEFPPGRKKKACNKETKSRAAKSM
jgi:hypothetical protein